MKMKETEKKYFVAARELLQGGDITNACCHYYKVQEENSENAEAEFFAAYLGYNGCIEENNGAAATNAFKAMTKCLEKAVKSVKKSDGDEREKLAVLSAIVELYTPITRFLFTKRISTTSNTIESGVLGLYALGSAIKNEFGSDPKVMKIVIEPWKEAVALQRQWYAYKYNGVKPEDYVAEIQKVEPSYTMPKKAGCISVGG